MCIRDSRVTTLAKASTLLADNGTGFPVVAVASQTVGLREALSLSCLLYTSRCV